MRRLPRLAASLLLLGSCGAPPAPLPSPAGSAPLPPTAPPLPPTASASATSPEPPDTPAPPTSASAAPSSPPPCPENMAFVQGSFCPQVERRCLRKETNKPNHLEICHEFAEETRCIAPEEPRAFCIDRYEYPNQQGAHPAWMVSWWDAEATCRAEGKRLCHESEWIMACEGPQRTPFPYGWARDQEACNIDNIYITPRLNEMYSSRPEVASRELARLDQSTPSGAMARCKSGYGVHDMTGNFDEWVTRDDMPRGKDKGKWAALKGGAWGHVRNACRPRTTSHSPEFTYYFISFRCCADAQGHPVYKPNHGPQIPEVKPARRAPAVSAEGAPGPSKQKVKANPAR